MKRKLPASSTGLDKSTQKAKSIKLILKRSSKKRELEVKDAVLQLAENSRQVPNNIKQCNCIASLNTNSVDNLDILASDNMDTRFIKIMRGLVVYKLGLMLIAEINAGNKSTILQALAIHDHPIIIKTTKNPRFWLYLPQANKQDCYLYLLRLKQTQRNTLQVYWQQQGVTKNNPYKFLHEPTLEIVQLNNMIINAAQTAKIKLEQFKPLEDGRYYSLVLLTLPGFANQPQSEQLKLLRPYQTDARHYPNAILVQDRESVIQQFWFYYDFPQAEERKLRVLPVNAEEQQALREFFAARAYDNPVTITAPDASTKVIDNIILRHVPAYSRPLLAYLGVKFDGLTDGFLAGIAYAILEKGPRYIYKARLFSFDLSFMAVAELEPAKLLALKELLPALIRDCQQQFWLCYISESSAAPILKKFENVAANDLAFLNAIFNSCKKNKLLVAMEVNRMSITINGTNIPGVALYRLIAKYTGYTRAQDDYLWYFYELFGDVVGGELARYLLGNAAPRNQLVSIPYAAPGLISELFPGNFINFAELPAIIAGIGTTLLYPAAAQRFRQLFLAQAPHTPLATLSMPAQQALIMQFILAQKNIANVIAGTLFLSDSDTKPANIGLLLQELHALVARIDFGCAFFQLQDFTASAKNLLQAALGTELLYIPNFRHALLKLANLDMTELSAIVEAATARFIHAWDGIKLSAETREKFANHLGLKQQLLHDFIDAAGVVRYQSDCTQRLSATIIAALTVRQDIFKQYAQMLEQAPVIRALHNNAHGMLATVHDWQLNGALISFASCASSNNAAAIKLMGYKTIQLTKALQLIELKCRPRAKLPAEQSCLLNALIKCTYYTALKSLAAALRFATTQPKAIKIYELLLYKLDNYPIEVAMHVRQILLETAMQGLFMGLINLAKIKSPSKQGLLIAASTPFRINEPLRPKLKASLQTLKHLTPAQAKPVSAGDGVLALLQVGNLKPKPIVLPGGSSLAPSNKKVLLTTIALANNSLLGDDYSGFVKSFNAATNLTLTGKELLSPSSEPASILPQLCLAVANSDANLTQILLTQLLQQLAITGISTAWQERLLLPLHVAVIKNAQAILVALITALREYGININAAIGEPPDRFTLLERAMMVNNVAIVEFLVKEFLANNIPFKLIDVVEMDKIKYDYCMGLNPIGCNEDGFKLLASLMPYALRFSPPAREVLLRLAASLDNSEAMLQLIAMQTNIHAADSYGETPLHVAVLKDSVACVELLLKHGANPYARDHFLRTPMIMAGGFNNKLCTRVLRQFGIEYQHLLVPTDASDRNSQVAEKIGAAISQNKPIITAKLIETTIYENPAILESVIRRLKSNIKKLPLNAPANHSGKTILWYLAYASMVGYPGALNRVISELGATNIMKLELNAAPTEGEEAGMTVLWLLAFLVCQGQAWALNKILEILPRKAVNRLNLNAAPQQGTFKGQSVLYLLITAATNLGYTEILETILKKASEEKTSELKLNAAIEYGDKSIPVLWLLAYAAAEGYPKPLLIILNKLSDTAMQKLALNAKVEKGESQGITVLWLLAFAAEWHPELLLVILDKLSDTAVQKLDLNVKAETGGSQGKTVLWLLAYAAAEEHPEPLLRILDKLSYTAVQKLNLNAKAETGGSQGKTVLWLLANTALNNEELVLYLEYIIIQLGVEGRKSLDLNAAPESDKARTVLLILAYALAKGHTRILETILTDYKEKISSLRLNDALENDINGQGVTGLWALAYVAIGGYPLALETMLEALSDLEIQKLDLNAAATTAAAQNYQGKTVLWLLLEKKIATPHATELDKIIELLINNKAIKAHNLNATLTIGESKGKSILWLLVDAAAKGYPALLEKMVSKLENKEVQMLKLTDAPRKYMKILGKIKNAYSKAHIQHNNKPILFGFKKYNTRHCLWWKINRGEKYRQSSNVANDGKKRSNNCLIC